MLKLKKCSRCKEYIQKEKGIKGYTARKVCLACHDIIRSENVIAGRGQKRITIKTLINRAKGTVYAQNY